MHMIKDIRLFESDVASYNLLECTKLSSDIHYYRTYHDIEKVQRNDVKQIQLQDKTIEINLDIRNMFAQRESKRKFNDGLNSKQLSSLLYYSVHSNIEGKRAFPSAGARYSIELYVNITNVAGMQSGLYFFDIFHESLIYNGLPINNEELGIYLLKQEFAYSASVAVFFVANMKTIKEKYGKRGERYVLVETGHISQNLYLLSQVLNISTVSVGGFCDDMIAHRLMLNPDCVPIYIQCLG